MKKGFLLLMILVSFSPITQSQVKGDYIWVSGIQTNENQIDLDGFVFDFNQKPMKVEEKLLTYGLYGSRASVCDEEGNLLFYSNGQGVLNADHQLMPNGDSLNWGLFTEWAWPYPELGYPGIQDNIILQDPANDKGYYLLHKYIDLVLEGRNPRELWMSYIDMTMDQGKGDVIVKNEPLTIVYRTGFARFISHCY